MLIKKVSVKINLKSCYVCSLRELCIKTIVFNIHLAKFIYLLPKNCLVLLSNALSLCSAAETMEFLNYWPRPDFHIDINNQESHLQSVLLAVKNKIIGKIKIINVNCVDSISNSDVLISFLNHIKAHEFQQKDLCKNKCTVKLLLTFNVVIRDRTCLQHFITFFTSQHERIYNGYIYNFHVILKHLTIECIDYTHTLLEVVPRKYL